MFRQQLTNFYNILLESYIVFTLFAIFFFVLIKYILTPYQISITGNFAIKQLKIYHLDLLKETAYFKENIKETIDSLNKSEATVQASVDAFNSEYENKQIIILTSMTCGIALLIAIPLIFGWLRIGDINWRHLVLVFFVNLVIIVVIEAIFIIYVIGQYSAIRFYPAFENGIYIPPNYTA